MEKYKLTDFLRDLDDFCNGRECQQCPLSVDGFSCTPLCDIDEYVITTVYNWKRANTKSDNNEPEPEEVRVTKPSKSLMYWE